MKSNEVIKRLLVSRNLTQEDLADALGVQRTAINRRLSHKGDMKLSTFLEMLEALDCSLHVTQLHDDSIYLISEVTDQ